MEWAKLSSISIININVQIIQIMFKLCRIFAHPWFSESSSRIFEVPFSIVSEDDGNG